MITIATAHGVDLSSLLRNRELVRLVGGVQPVILGDAAAQGGKKTRVERAGAAPFGVMVEILERNKWVGAVARSGAG